MDRETGHSSAARQFSRQDLAQGQGQDWDRARVVPWRQRVGLGRRVLLAIAGASLLMTAPRPVEAQTDCPSEMLTPYWPARSPQLNKTFCELLVFPTATLLNGDSFTDRIVDGSLSSDSREASADAMTLPSLWWNRDSLTSHLGGRRLVDSWISYQVEDSGTAVVDVMVNPQMWSVLTYNERYAVLNQFGTAARDFGYNVRFFQGNSRSYRMMGLYACNFIEQPNLTQTEPLTASQTLENNVQTCSANLDAGLIVLLQRNLVAENERREQEAQAAAAENSLQSVEVTSQTDVN
ncbi:hypothetical protein IQ265_18640 [Nodosilinea sp. LEGE 06152]|uniref:hypothetical protein n=1 Tax=Nodosilinea sp. LEGE 06152 TaxID=2777966 RepID=UPI001880B7BD|nr:hypothetical protein [Nodosilinea sp. LEGE 06152]MBE9158837.1 hypothetical protein [Nodosilinea sp. LEGE 06152]